MKLVMQVIWMKIISKLRNVNKSILELTDDNDHGRFGLVQNGIIIKM